MKTMLYDAFANIGFVTFGLGTIVHAGTYWAARAGVPVPWDVSFFEAAYYAAACIRCPHYIHQGLILLRQQLERDRGLSDACRGCYWLAYAVCSAIHGTAFWLAFLAGIHADSSVHAWLSPLYHLAAMTVGIGYLRKGFKGGRHAVRQFGRRSF